MDTEKKLLDAAFNRLEKQYSNGSLPASNFELMRRFHRSRRNQGLKEYTLINDLKALGEFSKVIEIPVAEMTEDDLLDFFDYLQEKSIGSMNFYKIRIGVFLKYCKRDDLVPMCTVKRCKSNKKLPENILKHEDIEKLIDATQNLRDAAYIATLYESGARRGELREMMIKHVEFDENGVVITLPKGKTGARRVRLVFASRYLKNYLDHHPTRSNKESYIWISQRENDTIASNQAIWNSLRRAAKHAGITKKVNPHAFRHARATYLAKHLTEQELKKYLGWTEGSEMASIYVHLSGKDIDDSILRMNGIIVEETKEDNALKTIRCPRCKEIQDKKASFCFKCGMPLNEASKENIESDQSNIIIEVLAELLRTNPDTVLKLQNLKSINE
jgi:integrase/recombinase XerD